MLPQDPSAYAAKSSLKHIDATLAKVPPLGLASAIAAFVGAAVAWDAVYYTASPMDDSNPNRITLQASVRLRMYYDYTLFAEIQLSDYPELQTLERGKTITLYGTILDIHNMIVDLNLRGLVIKPHHFWDRGY